MRPNGKGVISRGVDPEEDGAGLPKCGVEGTLILMPQKDSDCYVDLCISTRYHKHSAYKYEYNYMGSKYKYEYKYR